MIIQSVRELLNGRRTPVVDAAMRVDEACQALDELNVGAAAAMEGDRLVGVFSERDVIRKCVCRDRRADDMRVAEVMTPDPRTATADIGLVAALDIMIDGGFRHLPIVEGGRVLGLLSMRDIPTEYRLMRERLLESRGLSAVMAAQ